MIDSSKILYGLQGLVGRYRRKRLCPSCGCAKSHSVDRKGFHQLLRCADCSLQYRWPYETPEEMRDLYQRSYRQPGLTTDLPDPAVLIDLLKTDFRGSSKDFSRVIELLDALSIERPAKILDFGANWGYGVYQLQRAGYEAIGYEVSIPRAAYSRNLGVEILTDWQAVIQGGPYDVVFSSHVLEHTPDPAEALRKQCEVLNPGGVVIAYCPNGSPSFYAAQRAVFHRLWGRVHPVMLDETFVRKVTTWPIAIGAHLPKDLEGLAVWDRKASWTGSLNTSELLIVLAAPTSMNCE